MMMRSLLVLSALFATAIASRHPAAQMKDFLREKTFGDSEEQKANYAAFGGMRLMNPRVVQSSSRTLATSNDALNNYYYIDGEVVLFLSTLLDVCICGTTLNGLALCEMRTATTNPDGSITSTVYEYTTTQQCDGTASDSSTTTTSYPIDIPVTFSCDQGADDAVFEFYSRVESQTAYESLGQGMVESEYADLDDCNDNVAMELTFRVLMKCGFGAYNIYPTNCPNAFTESFSDSLTQVSTFYADTSSCTIIEGVQTRNLIAQCVNSDDDDHDDDGAHDHDDHFDDMDDDEVRAQYLNWFGQGFSSSGSSSSSDVELSEGEYYGLISGICVMFLIMLTTMLCYCFSSKKTPMSDSKTPSVL
jgi:hypothetical protein